MSANCYSELQLYVPKPDELWFYQKLLSDPETMNYNAPWFPPDGTIPFPRGKWEEWHKEWIGNEPQRFYAYIQRISDGAFVGDVNYHYDPENDWWDIGVLVISSERGRGYGRCGLELLIKHAFEKGGATCLHNCFEPTRLAARRIHLECGFTETASGDGHLNLILTREEYRSK